MAPPPIPPTFGAIALSTSSGPVGTVVTVSGNAGSGCVAGKSWFGVSFGDGVTEQAAMMIPPVAADGAWAATFTIPPIIPNQSPNQTSATTTPGIYQIGAQTSCTNLPAPSVSASFTVTPGVTPSATSHAFVGIAATPDGGGYWLAQADGGVRAFGDAPKLASLPSLGVQPVAPITGIAATADGKGYWLVGADGGVFAFGDAGAFGSLPGRNTPATAPIVGIAPTLTGKGYWLLGADSSITMFGDATDVGGPSEGALDVANAIGATSGGGFAVSDSLTGQFQTFPSGDLIELGLPLNTDLSAAAFTRDGNGAWQVGLDGGVRAIGGATFAGSLPGLGVRPVAPITGIAATPDGKGYWLLGADGGVFSFGDATFHGSAG